MSSLKGKFNKNPAELPQSKNASNKEVVSQMIHKTVNTDNNKTVNTDNNKTVNTDNNKTVNTDNNKTVNTDNNKTVNTVLQNKKRAVKKATFELEEDLHKQLKARAAMEGRKMIELVEDALKDYLNK